MPPAVYFTASFGNIPLLISSITTERGRDVVVQSPSQGDEHDLYDRGRRVRTSSCDLLFTDQPGLEDYATRYAKFVELAESGETQVFTHPLDGSYRARAEAMSAQASSDAANIKVSCTFVRDEKPKQVFSIAAGGSAIAGPEAVGVAVALTNEALAAAGLTSSAPAAAMEAVNAWEDAEDLDSQDVFLGVASVTQQIDTAIDVLELATHLERWPLYEQLVLLRYQVVLAAELFTSDTDRLVDTFVHVARPLLAICAELFGAEDAEDQADKAIKRNRIRAPGRIPAGTTLKMPQPRSR